MMLTFLLNKQFLSLEELLSSDIKYSKSLLFRKGEICQCATNEHVRRIDVVFKVLERIPWFIDEVTRIRGVDLYVEARTRGKYYYGFTEWANKSLCLILSARKVLLSTIGASNYRDITYELFIIKVICSII